MCANPPIRGPPCTCHTLEGNALHHGLAVRTSHTEPSSTSGAILQISPPQLAAYLLPRALSHCLIGCSWLFLPCFWPLPTSFPAPQFPPGSAHTLEPKPHSSAAWVGKAFPPLCDTPPVGPASPPLCAIPLAGPCWAHPSICGLTAPAFRRTHEPAASWTRGKLNTHHTPTTAHTSIYFPLVFVLSQSCPAMLPHP